MTQVKVHEQKSWCGMLNMELYNQVVSRISLSFSLSLSDTGMRLTSLCSAGLYRGLINRSSTPIMQSRGGVAEERVLTFSELEVMSGVNADEPVMPWAQSLGP